MGIESSSFGGISKAEVVALIGSRNVQVVVGTYTGDGTADREIDVGGKAIGGIVIGADVYVYHLLGGVEALIAYPCIGGSHDTMWDVVSNAARCVISSTNGFTLAHETPFATNTADVVYYYVVFILVV